MSRWRREIRLATSDHWRGASLNEMIFDVGVGDAVLSMETALFGL